MDNFQTGVVNVHRLLKHYRELSYAYKHETRYYCGCVALILGGSLSQTTIRVQNRAHNAEVRIMVMETLMFR
jgi:hypothetical protein